MARQRRMKAERSKVVAAAGRKRHQPMEEPSSGDA